MFELEMPEAVGSLSIRWLHEIGYCIFPQPTETYRVFLPNLIWADDWGQMYGYIGPVLENGWFWRWELEQPLPAQPVPELDLEAMIG